MKEKIFRKIFTWLMAGVLFAGLSIAFTSPAIAASEAEAQAIVDKAKGTLADFMSDSKYSWLQQHLKTAKGIVIFPQIIKGGFFIGGSGGTGILLVRDAVTNNWSEPAFYTLGSVTFGLQIGGEAAQVIMVAMSQKGINTMLSSSVKLGADASIAVGPVGGGAKGGVAVPAVTADFVSFAISQGLYAGLNLEGAVMAVRDSLNEAYYGRKVMPVDIIVKKDVENPGSNELRAALKRASASRKY
jgi:lipid-binding SYLF domain-containing protein